MFVKTLMEMLCIRCKGRGLCGKKCKILEKFIDNTPKIKEHFSGSSPPEVFVGRVDYPEVFCGVLSPNEHGDTAKMSLPEEWVKQNLSIEDILGHRSKLIYARNKTNIKSNKGIKEVIQNLSLTDRPTSTEFFLERKPSLGFSSSKLFTIMANPAPLKKAIIEENLVVHKKVDYLVSDYDARSVEAVNELYSSNISVSHIQKIFSTGLLGLKKNRKMVPTRWSITAVDDILGRELLKRIKDYPTLNEFHLFTGDYNGNHFEIILLPGYFEFEVLETSFSGSLWGGSKTETVIDYESFFGRKEYARNVVGAYYADRLATCEYLERIKKQAKVVVFHEEREEYYAPLGVGIIRETIRKIMNSPPQRFSDLKDLLETVRPRVKLGFDKYLQDSRIIRDYGKQRALWEF